MVERLFHCRLFRYNDNTFYLKTMSKQQLEEDIDEIESLDPNDPFVKELDQYLEMPYVSKEEEDARRNAKENELMRLKSDFDQTELGRKLHKRRDERFGQKAFERLQRELATGLSPWAMNVIGFATDTMFNEDREYQILNAKYSTELATYIERKGGGKKKQ